MNTDRFVPICAALLALSGLNAAHAEQKELGSVLRGGVEVKQSATAWAPSTKVVPGQWLRSSKNDTTLQVGGMTVRVESGASVRFAANAQNFEARGGRVYVRLAEDAHCQVATANKQVQAKAAEFVLDAGPDERLYVVDGQAGFVGQAPALPKAVTSWSKDKLLAVDGPDVRRRAKKGRFTEGQENRGRRLGEDEPSSTPTVTQTPTPTASYTPPSPSPSITPEVTPEPPPEAPPEAPPETIGGGIAPEEILLALLGAGGITAAILLTQDDDDQIIIPASP